MNSLVLERRQRDGTNFELGDDWMSRVFNGTPVKTLLNLNKALVILTLLYGSVHLVQYILAAFVRLLQQLVLSRVCCNVSATQQLHFCCYWNRKVCRSSADIV